MGDICTKVQSQAEVYSKKSSKQLRQRQGSLGCCNYQFTTRSVNSTSAECLLLFTDIYHKVQTNVFLLKNNENIANKVQEYLNVYLEAHSLGYGQCAIIEIDIPDFKVSSIAFLCVNIWDRSNDENEEINSNFRREYEICIEAALVQILQKGIRKVAVTHFNPEFGLPLQFSFKALTKTLVYYGSSFETVSIICQNSQSRIQLEKFQKDYQQKYETLLQNGFQFENSKGSAIHIESEYKESLRSNYF